jgi:hypothetical protein
VATLLAEYLKANYATEDELVDSRLCFCLDVFGERIVPANTSYNEELDEIRIICKDFKQLWMRVA